MLKLLKTLLVPNTRLNKNVYSITFFIWTALVTSSFTYHYAHEHSCTTLGQPLPELLVHLAVYLLGLGGIFAALRSNELRQDDLRAVSIKLAENESKYRRLFMYAPMAYQSLNVDGTIIEVNDAWLNLFKYKREEIEGKSMKDIVHPDFHKVLAKEFSRLKQAGKISGVECLFTDSTSRPVWVSVNGRSVYDDEGIFDHTHCILSDITSCKSQEEDLKRLTKRREVLLELSQLAEQDEQEIFKFVANSIAELSSSELSYISIVNTAGDEVQQVAYNDATMGCCKMNNKPNQTHLLESCGVWAECLRELKPVLINDYEKYESPNKKGLPEGHPPIVNHMNVPIFDGTKIVSIFGVGNKLTGDYDEKDLDDLTMVAESMWRIVQRKRAILENIRLEKQLRQAQKMEAIGTLAGGLSHDFNNILQIMSGYAEIMQLNIENGKLPDIAQVNAIKEAVKKGARLTGQLKYLSEKGTSHKEPLALNNSIKNMVNFMESTVPKMVNISYDLEPKLHNIMADVGQMEQVIMNLSINATHAMPDGGELCIETHNEYVDERCPAMVTGDYIVLTIEDTGEGIEEENLNKIFNPFFTTKKNTPMRGSGLGLSVVYGIIKNHGGYIECQSKVGEGTTFTIYLPAGKDLNVKQRKVIKAKNIILSGTETILVVDDVAGIRLLSEKILTQHKYNVIVASTGEEALNIYKDKSNNIDLIVLDLNMPGMGGSACLKKLLKLNPEVRVVIASGHSDDGPIGKAAVGAVAYLTKPFEMDDLLSIIRQTLDG